MPRDAPEAGMEFVEENGVKVLYVWHDGKRIARRGPGELWTILEPGYTVRGGEPGSASDELVVEYDPKFAKPQ
jgi:hypothetical protein